MKNINGKDIRCSYFMQHGDKPVVRERIPSTDWTLQDIANYVRTNLAAKMATEYLRSLTDEDAQKLFKKTNFDMIIPAGTLKSRKKGCNEVTPNGECCIDVDHISIELREWLFECLKEDKEIVVDFMFRSPRGKGLKIFVRYDPEACLYKEFYMDVSNYLLCQYGVRADKACADITHTCLLCYDDKAFLNSNIK